MRNFELPTIEQSMVISSTFYVLITFFYNKQRLYLDEILI